MFSSNMRRLDSKQEWIRKQKAELHFIKMEFQYEITTTLDSNELFSIFRHNFKHFQFQIWFSHRLIPQFHIRAKQNITSTLKNIFSDFKWFTSKATVSFMNNWPVCELMANKFWILSFPRILNAKIHSNCYCFTASVWFSTISK